MHDYGIWSLLPPVIAIALAVATRQVFLSLFFGIWVGHLVMAAWDPLGATVGALDAVVAVFQDAGNTRVILFCVMVGSLIALLQRSGGVDGFVHAVRELGLVRGPRSAGLLAVATGAVVFIESTISCLVTGTVARPIFDRLRISREKLAYVCDTCSAPICILIPLNRWGAFILIQLESLDVSDPVGVMVRAVPLNFYAIASLALLLVIVATGFDFGPMRAAERRARDEGKLHADGAQPMVTDEVIALPAKPETPRRAINMILPVLVMIGMVPVGIAATGRAGLPEGEVAGFWIILRNCSGSTAVFWAVAAGVVVAGLLYLAQRIMTIREVVDVTFQGAGALSSLAVLMILAFAIGRLCGTEGLQTGDYVASKISGDLPTFLVAPLLFLVAAAIAFSTGTSWGTFVIMLAVGLPIAQKVGMPTPLAVAAVLSGGVFGDHCSPISDTTIVASMASASDHIDHVRTQLPYALTAGTVAAAGFGVAGAFG